MKKRIMYFLAVCLILSGCSTALEKTVATVTAPPVVTTETVPQTTDTAWQERINLEEAGHLLLPQEVETRMVQCTAIDLDGDGGLEIVLQIGTESDDYIGFVVLRQDDGEYVGQGYYYRSFYDLRTDGSYTFSSGANDSGFGMLAYQDGQWVERILAQTYETVTTTEESQQIYMVGGEMTTQEAYERFVEEQHAKALQPWYPSLSSINLG